MIFNRNESSPMNDLYIWSAIVQKLEKLKIVVNSGIIPLLIRIIKEKSFARNTINFSARILNYIYEKTGDKYLSKNVQLFRDNLQY